MQHGNVINQDVWLISVCPLEQSEQAPDLIIWQGITDMNSEHRLEYITFNATCPPSGENGKKQHQISFHSLELLKNFHKQSM